MANKEKPPDNFKAIKVPIKYILKHPDINLPKISNAVMTCHKLIIHTLQFMKLYLLNYYDKNNSLPTIDKMFVNSCMKILCVKDGRGKQPKKEVKELKDNLTKFYDEHYKSLTKLDILTYTHLNTAM